MRAGAVLPLVTRGRRRGFLLVADTSPMVLHTEDVETPIGDSFWKYQTVKLTRAR